MSEEVTDFITIERGTAVIVFQDSKDGNIGITLKLPKYETGELMGYAATFASILHRAIKEDYAKIVDVMRPHYEGVPHEDNQNNTNQ